MRAIAIFPVVWCLASVLVGCGIASDTSTITEPLTPDRTSLAVSEFSEWSEPSSLGPTINTSFSDAQPALSKNALSLYFTSQRPESPTDAVFDNNIWVARRACVECPWGAPVSLGPPINTPGNDANANLSRDQHWLFFTTNRVATGARGGNDIWVSYRDQVHDDFGWQTPINLGPGVNTSANEAGPSYLENDELGMPQLFFHRQVGPANVPSGDIYLSQLTAEGAWGPASLVPELNSPDADQRPSIKHDGLEIYFWSSRDAGRGQPGDGFIWHAMRESVGDSWSTPALAADPINSASAIQPFIHSHGRTETLLLVRNSGTVDSPNLDLFMSTRTHALGGGL